MTNAEVTIMMTEKKESTFDSILALIRTTARNDVRLFFAPFVGAIDGVKKELRRIDREAAAARAKQGQ